MGEGEGGRRRGFGIEKLELAAEEEGEKEWRGGGGLRVNGTTTTTGVNIGGRPNEPGRELEVEKEDIGYSPNIDSSNNTY